MHPTPWLLYMIRGLLFPAPGSSKEHTKHHLELPAHTGKTQLLKSCLSLESA